MSAHKTLAALIDEFDEHMTAYLKRVRRDIEEYPEPNIRDNEEVRMLRTMVREINDIRALASSQQQPKRLAA